MFERESGGLRIENAGFLAIVLFITFAFAWLVAPFFGAILWGLVAGILFTPVNRKLTAWVGGRENLGASLTLILILLLIILPGILLGISLIQEAASLYVKLESGQIDIAKAISDFRAVLPERVDRWIGASQWGKLAEARSLPDSVVASGLQNIASRALIFGQGALRFVAALGVMLYLTYFLLRDGERIGQRVKEAVPLAPALRDALADRFIVVVRATIKGSIVVAVLQGLLGGLIFWLLGIEGALLWGLLMGLFSLVPAVGTGIVWVPVAIYLLMSGAVWQGVVMMLFGFFVIGMIDNLLRPVLVGHETRMPDFVVLIATVAGLQLMGLNGFIVGPIIAALFITVWQIVTEFRHEAHQ